MLDIIIRQGDITNAVADAIVNPANSAGIMGGGLAAAIKRGGGDTIEQEAMKKAPIKIGRAVATSAGSLQCQYVIHSPTMEQPAQATTVAIIEKATQAALECAEKMQLESLAIPGMGTGVGKVSFAEAAKAIVTKVSRFQPRHLKRALLIDIQPEMVDALHRALGSIKR